VKSTINIAVHPISYVSVDLPLTCLQRRERDRSVRQDLLGVFTRPRLIAAGQAAFSNVCNRSEKQTSTDLSKRMAIKTGGESASPYNMACGNASCSRTNLAEDRTRYNNSRSTQVLLCQCPRCRTSGQLYSQISK
jgi:hypothetical protein